jgi:hypothetical protein
MDLSKKIDSVEGISNKDFKRFYLDTQKPAIIKGLTKGQIAEKWDFSYFKRTAGNVIVEVYDNANKKSAKSAFTEPDLRMRFDEYLNILLKNEHTDLRIFLFDLFKHCPQLKKEFPCPDIFKGMLDQVSRMFFGSAGTKVRMHYDIDMSHVLLTQFVGKKRVVLIEPQYSTLLYRLPLNTYSLIDLDNPDYKKYPGLQYVKGYDFVLEHGDSVFMPSGYWHYMTYLEKGFSVSYRKINSEITSPVKGLMNLAVNLPVDKLLNKVYSNKWLSIKEQLAEKRVNKLINEANSISSNNIPLPYTQHNRSTRV